jgi:hypothetical protein
VKPDRHPPRLPGAPPAVGAPTSRDPREVERFLRPQPAPEIPRRQLDPPRPGLLAHSLLGHRIIRT